MGEVKETEERAMRVAILHQKRNGWQVKVVSGTGCGYDIESRSKDGNEIKHIEVKGRGKTASPHVFLTDRELSLAKSDSNYWVYLVLGPQRAIQLYAVPGKVVAERAEQEIKWRLRMGSWLNQFITA